MGFFVPEGSFRNVVTALEDDIDEIARFFSVSRLAAAVRMSVLGLE